MRAAALPQKNFCVPPEFWKQNPPIVSFKGTLKENKMYFHSPLCCLCVGAKADMESREWVTIVLPLARVAFLKVRDLCVHAHLPTGYLTVSRSCSYLRGARSFVR